MFIRATHTSIRMIYPRAYCNNIYMLNPKKVGNTNYEFDSIKTVNVFVTRSLLVISFESDYFVTMVMKYPKNDMNEETKTGRNFKVKEHFCILVFV